jgi:hypothetical protein
MTPQEELDLLNLAIAKVLSGGQSYSVDGQSMTRADLPTLYARQAVLERKIARAARGGMRVRIGVPR